MDYNRVALFVRVVDAGSFTAAGAGVGLPKSSVSRSVSQLEKDLGVRLLQRTTRKLVLTDAGQAYYDAVRSAVGNIADADAAARELGAAPRGRVRIATAPDYGALKLAPALAGFARKHPGIRIQLAISSHTVDLVAEGFDLAIRAGRLEDSSLVARRVGSSELGLFAAPAYLRRRGRPKSIDELPTHDWVLYRAHDGRATVHLTDPAGEARQVEVSGAIVADDLAFCRDAAEAGAGVVMLPMQFAFEPVITRRLEPVLPGWQQGGGAVYVVLPSNRQLPARVALVRDFLVEHLTRQIAEASAVCSQHGRRARADKQGGSRRTTNR